jgi:hypothetical protein
VNDVRSTDRILLLILMTVWAGMIVGVSFIATPVKFQAPSLTIPVGLEVGRYTYRLFTTVELCFLVAAAVPGAIAQPLFWLLPLWLFSC